MSKYLRCTHDLVEVLSTDGRTLKNAARRCVTCGCDPVTGLPVERAADQRQAIPVLRAQAPLNPPTRPCRICGTSPCNPADHVFASASGPSEPRHYEQLIADTRRAISHFESSK